MHRFLSGSVLVPSKRFDCSALLNDQSHDQTADLKFMEKPHKNLPKFARSNFTYGGRVALKMGYVEKDFRLAGKFTGGRAWTMDGIKLRLQVNAHKTKKDA